MKGTTMNSKTNLIFGIVTVGVLGIAAWGMPGWQHDALTRRLTETPVSRGGVGPLSPTYIRAVNGDIDAASSQYGAYHRGTGHTPGEGAKFARVRGLPAGVGRNVASLHAIADMAHTGPMGVNGWKCTPARQREAKLLLDQIKRTYRVPKKLPYWVTAKGTEEPIRSRMLLPQEVASSSGRSVVRARVIRGVSGGLIIFTIDGSIAAYDYSQGNTTSSQFQQELCDSLMRAGAVAVVMAVTPTGWVCIASVATYIAADAIINSFHKHYEGRYMKVKNLEGIAPAEFLENLPNNSTDDSRRPFRSDMPSILPGRLEMYGVFRN